MGLPSDPHSRRRAIVQQNIRVVTWEGDPVDRTSHVQLVAHLASSGCCGQEPIPPSLENQVGRHHFKIESVMDTSLSEDEWEVGSAASDDSELDFDDSVSEDADEALATKAPRRTWSGVATYGEFKDAKAVCEVWKDFVYTYDTRYKTDYCVARIYQCRSHVACEHRLKITCVMRSETRQEFLLAQSGEHSATLIMAKRRGIHPALRDEVDALLRMGWGAKRLRILLAEKYERQVQMLAAIPSSKQLENRKSYLVRTIAGGWELTNYAQFTAWASTRMCTTRDEFFSVTDPASPLMDELIIIETFVIAGEAQDEPTSFGVVVTSRRVFGNVVHAVESQGKELLCATDGTYKLHFGGWTVVDCGTEAVTWVDQSFVHRFIPWVYMFVRSESSESYQRMFKAIRNSANVFFGIDLAVAFGSLDHSDAIASAFAAEWPRAVLLTCWEHLLRQAKAKASLLVDPELYEDMIKPHLYMLRSARSHLQFLRISEILTNHWVAQGEQGYANWFRSVYLTRRWSRWHINGSGVTGVIPSQQGIEAHHGAIKKTCVPSFRASTSGVINGILPRILRSDGEGLCPATSAHYCEGPIPPEMFLKAQRLVSTTRNYRKVKKSGRLHAIYYNSEQHIVDGTNVLGTTLDAARGRRFEKSLEGHVAEGISAAEVQYELLSVQRVTVSRSLPRRPFEHVPIWPTTDIALIRRSFQCTCQSSIRSGWVCSHVLATLSLLRLINLEAALARVPIRRAPGRPPARRAALTSEENEDGFFRVRNLVRMFVRRPGRPLQWRVLDAFEVTADGVTTTSNFLGVIVGARLDDGVYVWSARFDQGDMRDYEVQDLAEAIRRAYLFGVAVTN